MDMIRIFVGYDNRIPVAFHALAHSITRRSSLPVTICPINLTNVKNIFNQTEVIGDSKMEGYEAGADSYISKPFSFELLCIRIKKLIEQQENRKMLFHKTIEITPSSITTTSLDEELVRKALHFVEENIDNPDIALLVYD